MLRRFKSILPFKSLLNNKITPICTDDANIIAELKILNAKIDKLNVGESQIDKLDVKEIPKDKHEPIEGVDVIIILCAGGAVAFFPHWVWKMNLKN